MEFTSINQTRSMQNIPNLTNVKENTKSLQVNKIIYFQVLNLSPLEICDQKRALVQFKNINKGTYLQQQHTKKMANK